jgi:MYXO-CTERM domain-containing protein
MATDGVCCDTACTGKCVSCKNADTGKGDGTCSPVTEGTDPASDCPDPTDPNSCGPDGLCDDKGACRVFAPMTKVCGAATCAGGVVDGHHCNASGTCIVGTTDCKPFVCADATNCLTSCTTAADCKATGVRCVAGACVALLSNGDACTMGDECASKNCVDGVCCNNACDGQCQACNTPGSVGTCSAIKGNPVGGRPTCNGGGTPCAGSCDGVGAACTYPSIGTDCGTMCTDGKYVEKKCDNKGACVAKDPVSCNNYACETTGCKNACTTKSDCATADFDCKDGKCVPPPTAVCADDGVHIQQGDTTTDCTPRRCKGGKCVETCVDSASDCAPNYVCGGDGKCTPAAPTSEPDPGCGCTTRPAPFSSAAIIGMLAIAASLGRRVRRKL